MSFSGPSSTVSYLILNTNMLSSHLGQSKWLWKEDNIGSGYIFFLLIQVHSSPFLTRPTVVFCHFGKHLRLWTHMCVCQGRKGTCSNTKVHTEKISHSQSKSRWNLRAEQNTNNMVFLKKKITLAISDSVRVASGQDYKISSLSVRRPTFPIS